MHALLVGTSEEITLSQFGLYSIYGVLVTVNNDLYWNNGTTGILH